MALKQDSRIELLNVHEEGMDNLLVWRNGTLATQCAVSSQISKSPLEVAWDKAQVEGKTLGGSLSTYGELGTTWSTEP